MSRASEAGNRTSFSSVGFGAALVAALVGGAAIATAEPVKKPQVSEADRVAEYLQQMGLRSLLMDQLSSRLKTADATEKVKLAERLARLYATAIGEAPDAAARAKLIEASDKLLQSVPQAKAFDLRLNLLRERYLLAEDAAERARLKSRPDGGAAAAAEATTLINSVKPQIDTLVGEVTRRETAVQLTLDNSQMADVAALELELTELRRWRSTANYYAGWASYYAAMLSGSKPAATDAIKAFAAILNVPAGQPFSTTMDTSPFQYDHVARAAGGTALALSLQGKDVEAMAWLDALRSERKTHPALASQWLAWRAIVLSRAGRWSDIERDMSEARRPGGVGVLAMPEVPGQPGVVALPSGIARVIAGLALEVEGDALREAARPLARLAVGDLVVRREIGAVLEIARKYGSDVLGDAGFVPVYVRGRQLLDDAQKMHEQSSKTPEEPSTNAETINAFLDAARVLKSAGEQPDVKYFARELAQASAMAGRATYLAGRLREGAELLARASELHRAAGDRAAGEETLWLAIGTLDRSSRTELSPTDKAAIDERLDQLAELFVREYPGGDRAGQIALRTLAREDRVDESAVRVLMSMPRGSALYEQSRRQLSRVLYRIYRAAPAAERGYAGARFLRAADELLAIDQARALGGDRAQAAPSAERMLITARQMLDVLLSGPTPDATRAQGVLDAVDKAMAAGAGGAAVQPGVSDEIALRRVQLALAKDDLEGADASAEQILIRLRDASTGPKQARDLIARYHVAVRSSLLQDATRRMDSAGDAQARVAAAKRAVKHGMALLDEIGQDAAAYASASVGSAASATAAAAAVLWRESRDASARDLARAIDRKLLVQRPSLGTSLERLAELSEAAGELGVAAENWRALVAGLEEGSEPWFRARFNALRLLAAADPTAATAAIKQHFALHPRGVEPWHARIVQLASSLGVQVESGKAGGGGKTP